jgi:DNA-binding GntR family transcriptional regulator
MKSTDHSYRKIAADLRDRISRGELKPSQQLPTEVALAGRYGVSRITVRRALSVLQEERLVSRRQGSGTYVSPQPTRRIPLMIDYTGSMRNHAPNLRRRVLSWRWIPAGEQAAEALRIPPDELVLYAERVDDVKGVPVAWDQAWIARSFGDKLTEHHLGHVDFVEIWTRTSGFRVELCTQIIEADEASEETARHLGLKRRQPVLKSTEVYLTYPDRPAGLFISRYNPAHIVISSRYRWTHHREEA